MASLRVRLVLLTLFVAACALASVAVLSRVAVRTEYRRLVREESAERLSGLGATLDRRLAPGAGPAELDAHLVRLGGALRYRLVLLADDGRVLGASSPELRATRFRMEGGGRVVFETEVDEGGARRRRQMVLMGAPRSTVHDSAGGILGTLVALPLPQKAGRAEEEPRFLSTVNRWLLLSALGSGALALILSLALSRHILRPVEAVTAAARRMEAGDITQRVPVSGTDEVGALAHAFNAMADAVGRAESARRDLVADVAHELRTPLTNLQCQVEAMQDSLQPMGETALASLHEEVVLLARLVSDLQDLALGESGQLALRRGPVDVAEAVEAALGAVRPLAASRRVRLSADVAGAGVADADRERLAQVLRNLLANALTHAPDGGEIAVTAREYGGRVSVEVADDGAGIPPEHLTHVFDRFYRVDPSRTRATGGAGLGLAIVKQIVEAHGGAVEVASEEGRGTRVTFILPSSRNLHPARVSLS